MKKIRGTITLKSGLHIGDISSNKIGGLDSPTMKIKVKNRDQPYIPGSSFKGKCRKVLLDIVEGKDEHKKKSRSEIDSDKDKIDKEIKKLFDDIDTNAIFRDCFLNIDKTRTNLDSNEDALFEVKAENKINRDKGTAENPRFIERVRKGAVFDFEVILKDEAHEATLKKIFEELSNNDYLGGSGTRGYGWVEIKIDEEEKTDKQD